MNEAFQVKPIHEKQQEISWFLTGYWANDTWHIQDPFFDELHPEKWSMHDRVIDFTSFSPPLRNEVKFMFAYRLHRHEIRLTSVISYGVLIFKRLGRFLSNYYPTIVSFVDIPYAKAVVQWRSYLIESGIKVNEEGKFKSDHYTIVFRQIHAFFVNFYDTREEIEKDIWNFRKIPGARYNKSSSNFLLDFTEVPLPFRKLVKKYLKLQLSMYSHAQLYCVLRGLRLFFIFLQDQKCKELKRLTRNDIEKYISWQKNRTNDAAHYRYILQIRAFMEHIQRAEYPEAPEVASSLLIFKEDIRVSRLPQKTDDVKFIPEGVLHQLEENLEHLPPKNIPIVILLRASGWRISDVLNLRYDSCLDRTSQGWYLCGDIVKTDVLGHRVPITDEVATIVQAAVDDVKEESTRTNNPDKLLFVRHNGRRKGLCPAAYTIAQALNSLAEKRTIVDDEGRGFHFGNHAFRHTKAVELINNGMSLLHVQKWMAHASPEMTLRYAKILDTSMRKSWEEATKQGLFKIDAFGKPTKIDIADVQNEDLIEWEYIRSNLDAVRMPLGYCMKPKKQECHTQLNPCLTCRNLCTSSDFIPQYELEIQETRAMIERGKTQGRAIWVEKNEVLLVRYEAILAILKEGKTHHNASKKGREYVGEERNSAR